jgi:hypothetical protein
MSRSIHAAPGESLPYNHHLHQFRAFLKHERGFADATIVNRERKLPSPNRLLRPTNTLADILYLFAQPNPATNKSRIAHAKPIAPPRPPRQRLRTKPPCACAPAGRSRVHAATRRRRTCR